MPTVDRLLKQLISKELNLIEYKGSRKAGGYVPIERGEVYIKSLK